MRDERRDIGRGCFTACLEPFGCFLRNWKPEKNRRVANGQRAFTRDGKTRRTTSNERGIFSSSTSTSSFLTCRLSYNEMFMFFARGAKHERAKNPTFSFVFLLLTFLLISFYLVKK